MNDRFYARHGKRLIDIGIASIGLVLTAPVQATALVAIRVTMGTPVFFRQQRPGIGGRPFTLIKMRTMREAPDSRGGPLADAERLTSLGAVLRSTSIDELPQLWNVLRGDMSLVGPRPLLMAYLERYTPEQARRHEVRPGITGWAQVNGRNGLSWNDKFLLDVWYVDHQSLALDLRVLWTTLRTVSRKQGISAMGHATMPEFFGAIE